MGTTKGHWLDIYVLLAAAVALQSCMLASPVGNFQVPYAIGDKNIRFGAGGGGSFYNHGESGSYEGDLFLDLGLSDYSELRFRLSGYVFQTPYEECDHSHFMLGPGVEYKNVLLDRWIALLVGYHLAWLLAHTKDGCNDPSMEFDPLVYPLPGLSFGFVFGVDVAKGISLVLTPKLATPFPSFDFLQATVSLGMDFTAATRFSFRPEVALTCMVGKQSVCVGSVGGGFLF